MGWQVRAFVGSLVLGLRGRRRGILSAPLPPPLQLLQPLPRSERQPFAAPSSSARSQFAVPARLPHSHSPPLHHQCPPQSPPQETAPNSSPPPAHRPATAPHVPPSAPRRTQP